ncbi:hypothetical protein AB0I28_06965 [Phytomonospora sp. NPDC050363]|uniref:hypothetical protein n=1 Tax=Phytomonospora sp. NPDC050363 TaxID=3155642 RepID=UPI0033FB4631
MPTDAEIMAQVRKIEPAARKALKKEMAGHAFQDADWETYLAGIPKQFDYFLGRDPADLDDLSADLKEIRESLDIDAMGLVKQVAGDVQDWHGLGADTFREEFLGPFEQVKNNQLEVITELRNALDVERKIIEAGRGDLLTIAKTTTEALEEIAKGSGGGMPKGVMSTFALVGAVIALCATGGAASPLVLGLTITGGVLSVGGTLAGELTTPSEVGGGTASEVLLSMQEAIHGVLEAVQQSEEALGTALAGDAAKLRTAMDTTEAKRSIVAARTRIMDGPDLGDFRPPLAAT